jgi:ribosome-associated translation inhibitor RaiA
MSMQTPLKITFHHLTASDALEQHIRDQAAKLDAVYPRITSCHITVEMPHKHKANGRTFNVRIDVQVPGSEIAVNRTQDEDAYVALRDGFDAATRMLEDYARRQRGDTKHHERPQRSAIEPNRQQGEAYERS